MELVCEDFNDVRLIKVAEARIDAAVAIQFKDKMREATENGPSRILLDLSHVTFLDSSGIGAVVAAKKQAGPDRSLELAGLTPAVEKVFRLTRLDSVFTIHPDAAAATVNSHNAI
jgi:anti-sigma B factor antagonist